MENRNPYASPRAQVADARDDQSYAEIKIFSPHGRLGRVRYVGYSAGVTLLMMLVLGILAAALAALLGQNGALIVVAVGYIAILVVQILLTIQRAHDMNMTGWISVISFIPLGVLVFWFWPGTKGANEYGLQPPPNTLVTILLAFILPLVGFVGILAAIAVPAYQDYTIRAQVSEGLNLAAVAKVAIAESFERLDAAPANRVEAGMTADPRDTSGKYVESIDIDHGTILIAYGSNSNSIIAGRMIALQPYVRAGGVVWRCAEAPPPSGTVAMDDGAPSSASATDIEPKYLPSACRP
jgi:uncharacterized membrane protein YhaH (DUF805 family)/Tfp pilus assembly protein PilE